MRAKQRRGIESTNQDFRHFDQVRKDHVYRLSEGGGGEEEFDDDFQITHCDMRDWFSDDPTRRDRFAQSLGSSLEEIGFAVLEGTGVARELYDRMDQRVCDLFEHTTREERTPFLAQRQGSINQGYFPPLETTIIHPDLVEGWVFCRRAFDLEGSADFDAARFWPRPEDEPVFRELVHAHEPLILPVMQSILHYLGCDPHLYDRRLTKTNFGLRLNYYPAAGAERPSGGRMLGHEDVDLFTFLPAPTVEGLQVYHHRSAKWIRLDPPRGSLILNTGDYMQRITNDRLPSTTHRVSQPRQAKNFRTPRVSTPMAIYVWEDEVLQVLDGLGDPHYPPVSALSFHTHTTAKYYGEDYAVD